MTGSMREGQWVIGLLRAFRLERGGEVVARFEGRKEELLLAYLALSPQSAHRRTSIAEELWPGKEVSSARRGLSYSLCILREQLLVQRNRLGVSIRTLVDAREQQPQVAAGAVAASAAGSGAVEARTVPSNDRPSTSCSTPVEPGSGTGLAEGTAAASSRAWSARSGENRTTVSSAA